MYVNYLAPVTDLKKNLRCGRPPHAKRGEYRPYLAVSVNLGDLFPKRARSFRRHFNRGWLYSHTNHIHYTQNATNVPPVCWDFRTTEDL